MSSVTKAEKEKLKLIQDKCQGILNDLLKDEDNKYCEDCDAKGKKSRLKYAPCNLLFFYFDRTSMGILEPRYFSVHQVCGNSSKLRSAHQQSKIRQPRLMDPGTSCGMTTISAPCPHWQ